METNEELKAQEAQIEQEQKNCAEMILSAQSLVRRFMSDFEDSPEHKFKENEWIREALNPRFL